FENRIEDLLHVFGVTLGEQLHRALHVGKQHRHLFAFALENGPGGENLVRQVLWRVGLRRRESRVRRPYPTSALGAELGRGEHLASTMRAEQRKRGSTFLAKFCPGSVFVLALRADHRESVPADASGKYT